MAFYVYEGIDRSGKSSLSVNFAQYLNKLFIESDGLHKVDPHFGDFIWTKEPQFTTEEADLLNSPGYLDEYKRERLFFESRLKHQDMIAGKNIVCDRYIWSGLAYAFKFSTGCFRLLKELYLCENLFIQPDLYIFLDTPPEVCFERDHTLDLDNLRELRDAYLKTKDYLRTPVLTMPHVEGEENALREMMTLFENYMSKKDAK